MITKEEIAFVEKVYSVGYKPKDPLIAIEDGNKAITLLLDNWDQFSTDIHIIGLTRNCNGDLFDKLTYKSNVLSSLSAVEWEEFARALDKSIYFTPLMSFPHTVAMFLQLMWKTKNDTGQLIHILQQFNSTLRMRAVLYCFTWVTTSQTPAVYARLLDGTFVLDDEGYEMLNDNLYRLCVGKGQTHQIMTMFEKGLDTKSPATARFVGGLLNAKGKFLDFVYGQGLRHPLLYSVTKDSRFLPDALKKVFLIKDKK